MGKIIRRVAAAVPAIFIQLLWIKLVFDWLSPHAAGISLVLSVYGFIYVLYIITKHDEGTYKILWLLIILSMPIPGTLLYLMFGNQRTGRPLKRKLEKAELLMAENIGYHEDYDCSDTDCSYGDCYAMSDENLPESCVAGSGECMAENCAASSDECHAENCNAMSGAVQTDIIEVRPYIKMQKMSENALESINAEDPRMAQTFRYIQKKTTYHVMHNENAVYYPSGEELFERMMEELEKAEKFIYAEYFIVQQGLMWNSMVDVMARKAAEGVEVRFMYDDMGSISTYSERNVRELKKKGIKCLAFNQVKFIKGTLNYRDHRKMLIIDGKTAFSGGVNLADEYINHIERFGHWKDVGFCISGIPVISYTRMFLEFWNAFSDSTVQADFPEIHINKDEIFGLEKTDIKNKNDGYVLSYYDSPLHPETVSNDLYIDLLSQSVNYVWFYTPYLTPGDLLLDAMIKAAARGVDVRIVLPGIPDKKMIYRMSRSYYSVLVEAGVRIYEYTPGFLHAKACIMDDKLCSVGTVNLDYRSLFLHFENNSVFYKASLQKKLKKDFEEVFSVSRERTKETLKTGFVHWIVDGILRIFAPLC